MSTHHATPTSANTCAAFMQSARNETNATQPKSTLPMKHIEISFRQTTSIKQRTRTIPISCRDTTRSHSNDNVVENKTLTDLDSFTIMNNRENECPYEFERLRSTGTGDESRCEVHKKEDVYGKGSIIRKRVDVYGGTRQAADLKFKCIRSAQEWMEAVGRTMGTRVCAVAVIGLLLTMLATSTAAPTGHRAMRHIHHEKSAVSSKIYYIVIKQSHHCDSQGASVPFTIIT
ncbi:hypothetical protein O3G_MSEX007778 [Manduca sexta]|uniref:Uncharacterized protein n=1 Tax=Manduca sexta TaxID=7130 RepID=A0A921Z885_MANSE|nr:hypothetical protein O3G_MSEX007778 [Manduca sexta]KAG6452789.1 hypothetical protein O3G_MSEX007778 [Manduca sexta]KAG6452790.1 hypothetical protein O3G_MSEX007778 [Manduca sexta]